MSEQFTLDDRAFRAAVKRFATEAPREAADGLNEIAVHQRRKVASRAVGGLAGSLGKSVQSSKATARNLAVSIGSPLVYARIHHHGGTIKAGSSDSGAIGRRVPGRKAPKFLTIPMPGIKGKRARDFGAGVFTLKLKDGRRFLVQKATGEGKGRGFAQKGKGGMRQKRSAKGQLRAGLRFLFRLVESVTLRARPYMYWSRDEAQSARRILIDRIKKLARGGAD